MLEGLRIAHAEIQKLIDAQLRLRELAGKPKWEVPAYEVDRGLYDEIVRGFGADVDRVTAIEEKKARQEATVELRQQIVERLTEGVDELELRERTAQVKRAFAQLEKDVIRRRIAVEKRRPDGRGTDEIRPITCEVGLVPRTHGSALFTRGQTQALTLTTLGATGDAQRIDTINPETDQEVPPPLQLPAVLGGGDGLHARPQAPRHRARRARRARARADAARRQGVPLHHPPGVGDPREQRLLVDGQRLRLDPVAHGCRACRSGSPWPASPWG